MAERHGTVCGAIIAITSLHTTARADGIDGPPLLAWFPNYNQSIDNVARHGSYCLNRPGKMPAERQTSCEPPALTSMGTGRYFIATENGAPFPATDSESGFAAFVTTIGSNAICFEESTSFSGHTLESWVRCVDPVSGSDVESEFSWSYRADSLDFPQETLHAPNVAYARVDRDGTLVAEESWNPLDLHDDDIVVRKNEGPGDYTVVFRDMNPLDAALEPTLAPYNVLVQKTCAGETDGGAGTGGCFRSMCVPAEWTAGDFRTWDTTIQVRCFASDGSPRDTGFRVLFGDEGFNSQGGFDGGYRYGWVDWSIAPDAEGCHGASDVMSNSQHETPPSYFPGLPVEACRASVGTYHVNFHDYVTPYSADGPNVVVSSREANGAYCNAAEILCGEANGVCAIPGTSRAARIVVSCFDSSGRPSDSRWTMNMTY